MEKPIKVFFNGKAMRDLYPHATRFQVFKYRVRKFFRKVFFYVGIPAIIVITFLAGGEFNSTTTYASKEIDVTPQKLSVLKDGVVSSLKGCESAGYKESDGVIILDTNGLMSIGPLQFQKKTVQHYYKTLYSKEITGKEAVEIALSDEKASALAKDIIFTTDKGIQNWINCDKKLGLSAEIKVLKKLDK